MDHQTSTTHPTSAERKLQAVLDNLPFSGNPLTLAITTVDAAGRSSAKPLLLTRTVETKAGWRGQVIVGEMIVKESEPFTDIDDPDPAQFAARWANAYVMNRLVEMLVGKDVP